MSIDRMVASNQYRERILIVESDPEICAQIDQQILQPMGFQVEVAYSATEAIEDIRKFSPDILITNLNLPDLSGKDLLVALTAQGVNTPIIVLAEKGMENDIIQALRIGASDYLFLPPREAEVVSVMDRALTILRSSQERENLQERLKQANALLSQRVHELKTILAFGRVISRTGNSPDLFAKILEGAIYLGGADCGCLLIRKKESKEFVIAAIQNLPEDFPAASFQSREEELVSLVAFSGKSLAILGEQWMPGSRLSDCGKAALIVPVKLNKQVLGLIVVLRKNLQPFGPEKVRLLEAIADFSSFPLANADSIASQVDQA